MKPNRSVNGCSSVRAWTIAIVCATALGVECGKADAPPAPAAAAPGKIVKTGEPVVIDGDLSDAVWQRAEVVGVDWIYAKNNEKSAGPRMTARYAWDDRFLYIGYEVFDTNLIARAAEGKQGPADNQRQGCENWVNPPQPQVDLAEFFLVFGENFFWEVHHTADNLFNDLLIVRGLPAWKTMLPAMASPPGIYFGREEYIKDDGEHTLAMATVLKPKADGKPSTVNDASDTDTGYTAELRFPWGGIGAAAKARSKNGWNMAGREVSILAVYQDGDAEKQYTASATGLTPSFFHEQTSRYPRYVPEAEQ